MIGVRLVLALEFMNPAMLAGLALAIAPIIIHLLSRRQYQRIQWGATLFLLQAEKETRRRFRFEQLLLVALRCLALGLLALLIARPFVKPGLISSLLGGSGGADRVLILDDSASAGYRVAGMTDFLRIQDSAARLLSWIEQESPTDPVWIYRMTEPAKPIARGERTTLQNNLPQKLKELRPTVLPAPPRAALEAIARDLGADASGRQRTVYVISDYQRSAWAAETDEGAVLGPIRDILTEQDRVVMIPVAKERANMAIISASTDRPQTVAGLPAAISVTVANFGAEPARDVDIRVDLDGAAYPAARIDTIGPGETAQASFELTAPDPGTRLLTLALENSDGFDTDDVYRLTLDVKPAVRVLIVNGEPATDPLDDEAFYLRNALAPVGVFASGLDVTVITDAELEGTELSLYDVVMLCNVVPPRPATVESLERFAKRGGGVAMFMGDHCEDIAAMNEVWYRAGAGISPLRFESTQRYGAVSDAVGLARDGDRMITALLPGSGADSAQIRVFALLQARDDDGAREATLTDDNADSAPAVDGQAFSSARNVEIIARFTDDARSPALAIGSYGLGRVALFMSSIDAEWNTWPRTMDGSFVVTMLELAQHIARPAPNAAAIVGGESIELSLPPEGYAPQVEFQPPDYPRAPAVPGVVRTEDARLGERLRVAGPMASELGVYQARMTRTDGGSESRPICVNLSPDESDLSVARQRDLAPGLSGLQVEWVEAGSAFADAGTRSKREIWPTLLIVLVGILMSEQYLAWWFGRPRGESASQRRRVGVTGAWGRTRNA
ncbi:MAG: BatA domain-containing protein [Phycisphaerales bacterium]|nr:BatA domain-containing protein [Phycisphaerales bacterium]